MTITLTLDKASYVKGESITVDASYTGAGSELLGIKIISPLGIEVENDAFFDPPANTVQKIYDTSPEKYFISGTYTVIAKTDSGDEIESETFTFDSLRLTTSQLQSLIDPPVVTAILADQVASPAVIPISNPNVLTDISILAAWSLGADAKLFTLMDADTGEIRYNGTIPRTVMVTLNLTASVVTQFDNIYAALMRTPDGGSKAEEPGSRIYTETINSNNGQEISSTVAIKLQPLDKLKINVANMDDDTDIKVTIATLAVK